MWAIYQTLKNKQIKTTKLLLGFTIVEVTIVIVIIGILTSITTVAYNGFQKRTRNVTRLEIAKSSLTSLEIMAIKSEDIPSMLVDYGGGLRGACIGSGYLRVNGDANGDCGYASNGWVFVSEVSSFKVAMSKYGASEKINYPRITRPNGGNQITYLAPFVYRITLSGVGGAQLLEYALEGANQKCGLKPLVEWNGASTYSLAPSNVESSYVDGDTTICMIHIN